VATQLNAAVGPLLDEKADKANPEFSGTVKLPVTSNVAFGDTALSTIVEAVQNTLQTAITTNRGDFDRFVSVQTRHINPLGELPEGGNEVYEYSQSGVWYRVHIFTSNGSLSVGPWGSTVEYLIVGGGGAGGGRRHGGGGGGGAVVTGVMELAPNTSYPVVVGAGGVGNLGPVSNPGANSSFAGLNRSWWWRRRVTWRDQ
jgi:hypothetical protein